MEYKTYVIVKKVDLPPDKKYQGLSKNDEYEHLYTLDTLGIPMGRVEMTEEEVKKIESLPQVVYVEEEKTFSVPNPVAADDINFSVQYHNAPQVWQKGFTGKGIKVAVLDTGLDKTHAETTFKDRILAAGSFAGDGVWYDRGSGHATHVTGIIADAKNQYGMAPECSLLIGKVLADDGGGTTSGIIKGITWAVNNGAHVINMSLGGKGNPSDAMSLAVNAARERGVLVVCAAGNDQRGKTSLTADEHSPGVAQKSITVAAVNSNDDSIAEFSSWGNCVDVAAAGVGIVSLGLNGGLNKSMSGTSMATPHVAGALALALDAHLNPDKVEKTLRSTCRDTYLEGYKEGHGILDVEAVINNLPVESKKYFPELLRVNLSNFNKNRGELLSEECILYIGKKEEIGRFIPKG